MGLRTLRLPHRAPVYLATSPLLHRRLASTTVHSRTHAKHRQDQFARGRVFTGPRMSLTSQELSYYSSKAGESGPAVRRQHRWPFHPWPPGPRPPSPGPRPVFGCFLGAWRGLVRGAPRPDPWQSWSPHVRRTAGEWRRRASGLAVSRRGRWRAAPLRRGGVFRRSPHTSAGGSAVGATGGGTAGTAVAEQVPRAFGGQTPLQADHPLPCIVKSQTL